jgi:hypothetical protein
MPAAAVHWPEGRDSLGELWKAYAIGYPSSGNFKLPPIFFVMFLPLLFMGAGVSAWISWRGGSWTRLQRGRKMGTIGPTPALAVCRCLIGVN